MSPDMRGIAEGMLSECEHENRKLRGELEESGRDRAKLLGQLAVKERQNQRLLTIAKEQGAEIAKLFQEITRLEALVVAVEEAASV